MTTTTKNDLNTDFNDNKVGAYRIPDMHQYVSDNPLPIKNYRIPAGTPKISVKNATDILFGYGVNSFNRFVYMMELVNILRGPLIDKVRFLKENWSACDHHDHKSSTLASKLEGEFSLHSPVSFRDFLTPEELEWVNGFGKTFRIYRGCDESVIAGASWTTDHEVAEFFTQGLRGCTHDTPVIVSATCDIDDILLAIDDRNEKELIINPRKLSDVLVTPYHKQTSTIDSDTLMSQ